MLLGPYKKLNGTDLQLSKTIQYTEEFLAQLLPNPFLIGNVIEVNVSTTATAFNHNLQATPQGWFVIDKTANIDIWRTDWDDNTITLDASGSGTIKVWVF